MPGNIPVAIEIDVSELEIGDQLHVSDVPLPAGVSTEVEVDTVVAQIAAPRVAAELEEGEEAEEGEAAEGDEGGEAPSAEASDDAGDE